MKQLIAIDRNNNKEKFNFVIGIGVGTNTSGFYQINAVDQLSIINDKIARHSNKEIMIQEYLYYIFLSIAIGIIWFGYWYTKYEFINDLIVFTIWEIYFSYLLFGYYKYFVFIKFFTYLNQMTFLYQILSNYYGHNLKIGTVKFIQDDEKLNKSENEIEMKNGENLNDNYKSIKNGEFKISLAKDINIVNWVNLWHTLRKLWFDYFDKQKYFIISNFLLLLFSTIFGTYRVFIENISPTLSAENEDIIFYGSPAVLYALLCSLTLITLMFLALKFPKVQKRQLLTISNQQYIVNDCIIQLNKQLQMKCMRYGMDVKQDNLKYQVAFLKGISDQLTVVMQQIKNKSLVPRIANVPINTIFLRMLWAMVAFAVSSYFALYY